MRIRQLHWTCDKNMEFYHNLRRSRKNNKELFSRRIISLKSDSWIWTDSRRFLIQEDYIRIFYFVKKRSSEFIKESVIAKNMWYLDPVQYTMIDITLFDILFERQSDILCESVLYMSRMFYRTRRDRFVVTTNAFILKIKVSILEKGTILFW